MARRPACLETIFSQHLLVISLRQSEIERKAFLMVIVAGLVSGLVALGGHAAITRQLSSPPAVESAPAR